MHFQFEFEFENTVYCSGYLFNARFYFLPLFLACLRINLWFTHLFIFLSLVPRSHFSISIQYSHEQIFYHIFTLDCLTLICLRRDKNQRPTTFCNKVKNQIYSFEKNWRRRWRWLKKKARKMLRSTQMAKQWIEKLRISPTNNVCLLQRFNVKTEEV